VRGSFGRFPQIQDNILEVSHSSVLNPLTILQREGKKFRICVDVRKVNQYTVPDREQAPLLQEPLQRFEGTLYMSTTEIQDMRQWSDYYFVYL
jgi:hypothetical protein